MKILEDLIAKAKSVLGEAKVPTERQAIRTTSFDRHDLDAVASASSAFQTQGDELGKTVDYAKELMTDLHAGFYQVQPKLRPAEEMRQSHAVNREVMRQLLDMPEVMDLRHLSIGDAVNSALAVTAVKEPVLETLQRVHRAVEEATKEAEDAQERAQQAAQQLQDLMDQAQQAQSPLEQQMAQHGLQAALDQFGQQQQAAQQAAGQAQQQAEQAAKSGANQIRSAAKGAAKDIDEQSQMASAFGVEDGELQRMSAAERIELAKKLKGNRLAKFMKLIGQFKAVQRAESRRRVTATASERHGITHSNHLERMVAGEYLNFADKTLETLMLSRWASGQLVTHDVRGKEKLGQGPIICVVDESGSMSATDVAGGSREAWSKALSLAMLDQARQRDRDFIYIGFSSGHQQHIVEFPKGKAALDRVMTMTEHFFSGGTEFETPLEMALDYIQKHYDEREQARPDIVFITDDEYTGSMPEDFMKRYRKLKDKTSIKTYGIALGCSAGGSLREFADDVREVTELVSSDPRAMGDLFRRI